MTKNNRRTIKIVGGLALAGLIAAGGSAFTATGLTSDAPPSQFIGGSINQSVSGAHLTSINYDFSDESQTTVTAVRLFFADASAIHKDVRVQLDGAAGGIIQPCVDTEDNGGRNFTCTLGLGYTGLETVKVTVS